MGYNFKSPTKFKNQVASMLKDLISSSVEERKTTIKTNLFKAKGQKDGE